MPCKVWHFSLSFILSPLRLFVSFQYCHFFTTVFLHHLTHERNRTRWLLHDGETKFGESTCCMQFYYVFLYLLTIIRASFFLIPLIDFSFERLSGFCKQMSILWMFSMIKKKRPIQRVLFRFLSRNNIVSFSLWYTKSNRFHFLWISLEKSEIRNILNYF